MIPLLFSALSGPMPKASIRLLGPGMTNLDGQGVPLSSAHQRLDNFPDSNPLGSGHLEGVK